MALAGGATWPAVAAVQVVAAGPPRVARAVADVHRSGLEPSSGASRRSGGASRAGAALATAAALAAGGRRRRGSFAPGSSVGRAAASSAAKNGTPVLAPSGLPARKTGVLLLNIGTPASTGVDDVRDYLSRFLGDDRVIDIPDPIGKFIVLQLLLGTRPAKSAANYKRIWDEERGSPLQFHTEDLVNRLQKVLGDEYDVRFAFQYSRPFTPDAVSRFAQDGIDRIILVPMFPQYASGTVGTCLASAYKKAADMLFTPFLSVVPPFFAEEQFLGAVRENIAEVIGPKGSNVDHMLFSFHGLPVNQCTEAHRDGLECDCQVTTPITEGNSNCYRAQCHETARRLAADLGLEEGKWSVGFQSRLTLRGTIKWITPYTDVLFEELAAKGVRRLAIAAPSFTADCIETLEELGISGQKEFREAGGDELLVIPCVNSSERWAAGLAELVHKQDLASGGSPAALQKAPSIKVELQEPSAVAQPQAAA